MTYDEMIAALVAKRKTLKLTQYELADRIGIHQGSIWKLETGRINRSNMRTLSRWAAALNTRIRVSFTLEDLDDAE